MRLHIAILISASLIGSQASASSLLIVDGTVPIQSPSILMVEQSPSSRSVMAIVDQMPVSAEQVSAIDKRSALTVLRAGVPGEALPVPIEVVVQQKPLSRPAQRAKERAERRAAREALRFGEPLPEATPETGS
ncbi:MAG: hypothetical protein KF874_05080 [Rhizobiaceae bacterium]|nr:hypothetical protein [Rhizobiaceae bacterium]